ncbi:MAG TPA: pitrilysin family protein [Acidimicrobiia bacterium]|nr:pitrilysin family protein [Acidimicrobiia bacterium]
MATGVAAAVVVVAVPGAVVRGASPSHIMSGIRRTRCASGLRVVTEGLPELHSVTLGAWVGSGARDEQGAQYGASHFLEHLLFKGTDRRSAREIAESIESVGGEMNAFTTHEQTVFYVRVPDSQLEPAFEVLADVLWNPAFRVDDVESERRVILEEIGMRDDTPDDLVHDLFASALFPEHPLGREVLGSEESITAMARADIESYHAEHYQPSNVVFAAAGNLTHDKVLELVDRHFPSSEAVRPARPRFDTVAPQPLLVLHRDTEQTHVVTGVRALAALDADRYALTVVNQVLGGGMSSRLFQEIRETRGLAYSVFSYSASFDETGFVAIYAGTAPEHVPETLSVIGAELDRLVKEGLSDAEVAGAKGHLVGSLAMSLESSASRMRRLGRSELVEGEIPSLDDLIARVDAVTADDVARVIDRVFAGAPRALAVVGPHRASEF